MKEQGKLYKDFEEKFPSLKGKTQYCKVLEGVDKDRYSGFFYRNDVKKFCLDKQRVRETIKKSTYVDDHEGVEAVNPDMLLEDLGLNEP